MITVPLEHVIDEPREIYTLPKSLLNIRQPSPIILISGSGDIYTLRGFIFILLPYITLR